MNTALFVVYLLVLIAIILGAGWALQVVRDLHARLRDDQRKLAEVHTELATLRSRLATIDRQAGQPDATASRLTTIDGRLDRLAAWFTELGKRVDASGARFDQLRSEQVDLAEQQVTASTRVLGLSEVLGDTQRRVGDLADRLTAIEREALPRLTADISQLNRTSWEIGAAQTFGVPPAPPWLPGHLVPPSDSDGEEVLGLYREAAAALGLEVVHVSEPRFDSTRRTIALRGGMPLRGEAISGLSARVEERVALLGAEEGPSPDDALARLLLVTAAAPSASFLLGPLLCVTDASGTSVHLLDADQLRGWVSAAGSGQVASGPTVSAGRVIELGPWMRARRDAERAAADRARVREELKEQIRATISGELRAEVEAEEIERIKARLRAELAPIVRRDLERDLRRRRPPRDLPSPAGEGGP
ncbi:hypothetical protein Ga0074812_109116 [Parafrankia irregularis]|uniref:Uncharacterized protein n=1 Tax=Parafrankia irregularis TaxID=795642 RepID=A0A0S4QMT9_9ACTN|nr:MULTISPECIES: hypothetical protein [Parafrankia]MBE3200564.1 hypothetical protein [Parafrankia sp. CH37]CUU56896.1 hypothetical protein Ga0074812_109116 [Parafrankia irregularis]